ncbi:mitochondrial large ribosomal subunit [Pyrrhoderma noxium]|uniref:Large ribosomal subunit protein mL49 n=1 Tax=Pyrrhoderma noxium TaxID=2282107 RepID=A0A286UVT6_9AGAM|nr:mitochondrial large ribosomal subunit [Pyrrhoderma noxium]
MFPSIATRQLATNTASSLRHLPYSVPRNSNGSLPVYSDIRNGGSRYLILLKNIKGDINTLRNDLASSLFEPGSDQTARLKAVIHRQDTIILTGGRWKQNVMDWLQQKGF